MDKFWYIDMPDVTTCYGSFSNFIDVLEILVFETLCIFIKLSQITVAYNFIIQS